MRQIKFRGKNSKDEWVYGSLIINETENEKGKFQVAFIVQGLPCASDGGDFYTARMERVKIENIGQFTGLYDKNGKEIYEGDIVRHPYVDPIFGDLVESKDGEGVTSKVVFHDGAFVVKYDENDFIYLDAFTRHGYVEVVGNIYDNPELLKDNGEESI